MLNTQIEQGLKPSTKEMSAVLRKSPILVKSTSPKIGSLEVAPLFSVFVSGDSVAAGVGAADVGTAVGAAAFSPNGT